MGSSDVVENYRSDGLLDRILSALRQAGRDPDHLTTDDLSPIDEFHSRRRAATRELAAMLAPAPGSRVIDIGSGIGGPARYLAAVHGCDVTGVDLTAAFVAAATELTRRTGLTDRVRFHQGSALSLPFPDASFDHAWSQNVAMNIEDRAGFYAEVHRVLRPGGRFAIQDVMLGENGPPTYPLMWADRPEISFLRTPGETRTLLTQANFSVLQWEDTTATAIAEIAAERARIAAMDTPPPPPVLGIHVIMGPSFRERIANGNRAQADGKTRLVAAVLQRD